MVGRPKANKEEKKLKGILYHEMTCERKNPLHIIICMSLSSIPIRWGLSPSATSSISCWKAEELIMAVKQTQGKKNTPRIRHIENDNLFIKHKRKKDWNLLPELENVRSIHHYLHPWSRRLSENTGNSKSTKYGTLNSKRVHWKCSRHLLTPRHPHKRI